MRRKVRALAKLRQLLESGEYQVNSRLPAERELAVQLGLSRGALRGGFEVLEAEGKVWRHVGKGTFVGNRPLDDISIPSLVTSGTSPTEILEARLLIEPLLARLAAVRATEADLTHLTHLMLGRQPQARIA